MQPNVDIFRHFREQKKINKMKMSQIVGHKMRLFVNHMFQIL